MSGIYGILVENSLVYIGKASSMEDRKRQHWRDIYTSSENKYVLLKSAVKQHCRIKFVVLEKVPNISSLLEREEKWIKGIRPCLNSVHNLGIGRKIDAVQFWDYVDRYKEVEKWEEV